MSSIDLTSPDSEVYDPNNFLVAKDRIIGNEKLPQTKRDFKIPAYPVAKLSLVDEAIEDSRRILELEDDWDGEGSSAYSVITWQRAVDFVSRYAERLREMLGIVMDAPEIMPGPNGSIDVDWETEAYELLVNIPSDATQHASFYGDDYGSMVIKGTFNPDAFNRGLLLWLANVE